MWDVHPSSVRVDVAAAAQNFECSTAWLSAGGLLWFVSGEALNCISNGGVVVDQSADGGEHNRMLRSIRSLRILKLADRLHGR